MTHTIPATHRDDPCAGHACDGCATCRSGVCCASAPALGVAAPTATDLDVLREAMAEDTANRTSFAELLYADALTRSLSDLVAAAEEREGNSDDASSWRAAQPPVFPAPAADQRTAPSSVTAVPELPAPTDSLLNAVLNQRKAGK